MSVFCLKPLGGVKKKNNNTILRSRFLTVQCFNQVPVPLSSLLLFSLCEEARSQLNIDLVNDDQSPLQPSFLQSFPPTDPPRHVFTAIVWKPISLSFDCVVISRLRGAQICWPCTILSSIYQYALTHIYWLWWLLLRWALID